MTDSTPATAATEWIGENDWVAVRRKPDGSLNVTIKWAMTRWFLLVGFLPGLIVGLALGAIS